MFFNKKPEPPPPLPRGRPLRQTASATAPAVSPRITPQSNPVASQHADAAGKLFGGLRFQQSVIETTTELSKVVFHEVVNEQINLGAHLFSRLAVARVSAASKAAILIVDKSKCTEDDLTAVIDQVKAKGFELVATGPQGYFAQSSLVMALSQGHLNSNNLTAEREIARDPFKNGLMQTFTDIISWAYLNQADDVDFAVDTTNSKSQICFKIGGRYVRPERHLLPTDTVIQMLGIAWQRSQGGASAQFEIKSEQQAQVTLDLPKSHLMEAGARVRLRWSGMSTDKGTTVTMRLQRLGEYAKIKSLEDAGYLDTQMVIQRRVINSEGGMVVLSGTVGSGKSTTIVQLIDLLPKDIKIQTLEDPVELEIKFAYQKTITRDLTATGPDPAFASATRALYRSALDVLYLGEIRDPETGLVARQVAESGHSVYTTTHARSALGIIDRFTSPAIGIPRDVLSAPGILKLLVYQALLPVTCKHCGKSPDDYAHHMGLKGEELSKHQRYFVRLYTLYNVQASSFRMRDPRGCPECHKPELPELNGLNGRTVVSEMVELDDTMLGLINTGKTLELHNYWRSMATPDFTDSNLVGKTTMECAIFKAARGEIDPREIEPRFMSFETVEAKRQFAERSAKAKLGRG